MIYIVLSDCMNVNGMKICGDGIRRNKKRCRLPAFIYKYFIFFSRLIKEWIDEIAISVSAMKNKI